MTTAIRTAPARRFDLSVFVRRYPFAFALVISVVLLALNLIVQPNFGPVQQLASYAPIAFAALALMPAILSGRGGIDLTVSPVMTLSGIVFIGYLNPAGLGTFVAVPILLVIGLVIGTVNGLLIVLLRLPPVVVTLAMMFVYTGINLKLAPSPLTISGSWVRSLAESIWVIPGALVGLAVPVIAWLLLARSAWGRTLYAVGGNDATAFSAGINVAFVRISAFALGSMIAMLGGLSVVALTSSAAASTSSAYVMLSIAAVSLGGISLAGGRGGVAGALFGAAAIFLVQRMLTVFNVPTIWLTLVYGLILIVAVILGAVLTTRRRERS